MAVPTTTLAIRYTGNGSAVTAYSIPFPFLDTAHIYAAVSSDGVEDPALLNAGDYTVTRLADGSGGSLVTAEAVTSPAEIVIFRQVPLTQPTVFQPAGPFPAKANETALDRTLMQIQQLNRRLNVVEGVTDEDYIYVPSGNTGGSQSVMIWENAAARGSVRPSAAGQLGVQKDTQSVWIAQSTAVGDWEEFARKRTNRIVIGLVADAGSPGSYQTAAATALTDWEVDAAIFAGDNNYNGPTNYNTDWAAFLSFINAGIAYPALGNHDVDYDGWETRHAAKFPYLPGNRRYYTVTLGDGLVDLFVLHSGRNSIWDLVEDDGNEVGSAQHTWFVQALAASKARWKIAVFHHPPATLSDDTESQIEPAMAWPELARMDLVCCGHTHMSEILKWQDTQLVNLSAVVHADGNAAATIQGGGITDAPLWADGEARVTGFSDGTRTLGRIVADEEKLTVEVWALELPYGGRRLMHVRAARDFSRPSPTIETFAPWAQTDKIGNSETRYVMTMPAAAALIRADVAITAPDPSTSNISWTLYGGAVELASGLIDMIDSQGGGVCLVPDSIIPRGTIITLLANQDSLGGNNYGFEISLTFQRLS